MTYVIFDERFWSFVGELVDEFDPANKREKLELMLKAEQIANKHKREYNMRTLVEMKDTLKYGGSNGPRAEEAKG
jgi:hypothetical protein